MDAKREILYVADPDQRKVFGYQRLKPSKMIKVTFLWKIFTKFMSKRFVHPRNVFRNTSLLEYCTLSIALI